jgi:menaquinone-specific isochorismate synthase
MIRKEKPELATRNDFALVQLDDRSFIAASAPFSKSSEPCKDGLSFYTNDFILSDKKPWRIPREWVRFDSLHELELRSKSLTGLQWAEPVFEDFRNVFKAIESELEQGELVKVVPVVSSSSELADNESIAECLIRSVKNVGKSVSLCAFQENGSGFTAMTPERLLKINGRDLRTMALAGTSTASDSEQFLEDSKERYEHNLVVNFLRRTLSVFGDVGESGREILDLGAIIHFLTEFRVSLSENPVINKLISALHPTPAVGVVPRKERFLRRVLDQRLTAEVPDKFGAPFGVKYGDRFESFVLIRGLFWDKKRAYLPSGCGIVRGSVLEKEWLELSLKRNWVRDVFSLN